MLADLFREFSGVLKADRGSLRGEKEKTFRNKWHSLMKWQK